MTINKDVREEVLQFLKDNNTLVLATEFNGQPGAATLYYTLDDDFSFYFITKRNSAKYQNILMNQKVAIVVGTGPSYASVQAQGVAEPVQSGDIEKVLHKFRELKTSHPPVDWPPQVMDDLKEKTTVLYKIIPHTLRFMNLSDARYPKSMGTAHHQVIPA